VKNILLLSDTHGLVAKDILDFAKKADEVWHAGDWLTFDLADEIEKLESFPDEKKPLKAVFGNVDNPIIKKTFKEYLVFECEGLRVLMIHIGGYPNRYNAMTKQLIARYKPKLVICGHSHILKIMRDPKLQHLHMNPGAAGTEGIHKVRTMIRFKIENGRIFDVEVIELKSPTLAS